MIIDILTKEEIKPFFDAVQQKLDAVLLAISKITATAQPTSIAKMGAISYDTLQAASDAAKDGDTILIQPGLWQGAKATASFKVNCTVEGLKSASGEVPELRLDASVRPAWGKAILVPTSTKFTVKNLILSGCSVTDDNGAGIRPEPTCVDLQVDSVVFTNNQDGVLGPDSPLAVYKFTNCRFDKNGVATVAKGYSHNIYVNKIQKLEMINCIVINSVYGHEIKSRAALTVITSCNVICGTEGRAIDLPNGGSLSVLTSNLSKAANANNNMLIGIAHEGLVAGRVESYKFDTCKLTNLRDGTRVMLDNKSPTAAQFVKCTFDGSNVIQGPYVIS